MNDPALNSALKWGILNSDATRNDPNAPQADPSKGLSAEAINALFGQKSQAELMKENMAAIKSPEVDKDNKLVAFDNYLQLIEQIDNANNMEPLGLWIPLVEELESAEPEIRQMAAECVSAAVQNNSKAQERALILGTIPKLVDMAVNDNDTRARKKAVLAISSLIRNFQAGLDAAWKVLPDEHKTGDKPDSMDMDEVDQVIKSLRAKIALTQSTAS